MRLNNWKLSNLIELVEIKNNNKYSSDSVRGISNSKCFIKTKANLLNVDLTNFNVVPNNHFSFNPNTARMGDKVSIAYNDTGADVIVSSIYPVFKIKDENILLSKYLMIYFNREEFDRYVRHNSWGSAREMFTYQDFCDIEICLPPIDIQKKYVAIYEGLQSNLYSYEKGLDDLKLICDGYIEKLRKNSQCFSIKTYLSRRKEKNNDINAKYYGISVDGPIEPNQNLSDGNILQKKKFYYDDFIFTPSGIVYHNEKIKDGVCSHVNEMFYVNSKKVISGYVELWLKRSEFKRYCDFFNISSVMNNFNYDTFANYYIPIPAPNIQNSIVNLYKSMSERKNIANMLKQQMNLICPILIKGSIEEARRS